MVWSLALRSDDAKQDPVVYGTKFGVVFLVEGPRTASIQKGFDCFGLYHPGLERERDFRLAVELREYRLFGSYCRFFLKSLLMTLISRWAAHQTVVFFSLIFSCFSSHLSIVSPMGLNITILPVITKDLPISPLFIAMQVQQSYNSSTSGRILLMKYSRSHAFRCGRKNKNPTLIRIELTTSALAGVPVTY